MVGLEISDLIFASSMIDFMVAKKLKTVQSSQTRKYFLWISLNLGFLFIFKYLNFFIDSAKDLFSLFGMESNMSTISIILPVGISFYTFQTLSYTFDVYYKKDPPKILWLIFLRMLAFFQLVAASIERSTHLLLKKNF